MTITRADLGLSCPSGGQFYVCDQAKIRFIGCCTVDPCADGSGSCPQSSLSGASFSSDHYDSISPQSCAAPSNSTRWFTCKSDQPPFLGCCSINACQNNGCPTANLLPATLSDNNGNAQVFLTTSTPSPSSSSGYSLSLGAILGIALGCAALVAIVLAVMAYRCGWLAKRRKQGKEGDGVASQYGSGPYSPHMSPFQDGHRSGEPSPGFPNSGFAPYSPSHSQYRHPQLSPALSDSWHGDNRHISNTSELSGWNSVAPDQKHHSYAPLLAPATELEGRDTERPVIAELPSSPANVQR
ncbi:uncharacterized protein GGS22DRAFT_105716 [Annulohypoxylon maeteangense]|uniref:uncharacterized protein n=1 Tax=Annulohypoxylon maeteangense TaxID=1927788 RepID=UPI0020086745|nr:uncharacterized protein GGS22DRAFT_105716 [Annulohypoxylon maeteangense]KAI0887168.1 hypothetical protein GGS22DRAFT_105716 [Annulohypoxylon maeteangense]